MKLLIAGRRAVSALLVAGAVAGLAGCSATQTIDQTDRFAQAGVAFAEAIPPVLDDSFALTVRLDSQQLIEARPDLMPLSKKKRLDELEKANAALAERLDVMRDLKRHSQLLKRYFLALQTLAQSDAPAGIGQATGDLVKELGGLSSGLKAKLGSTPVGDAPLSSVIPKAAALAATGVQAAVLRKELKEHGPQIEEELGFLAALFGALDEIAQGEFDALQAADDRDRVERPFVEDGSLPSDWAKRRADSFRARLDFSTLTQARKAAEALRDNFITLREGKLSAASVSALIADVSKVVAVFEAPKGS